MSGMQVQPGRLLFEHDVSDHSVSVIVPLYNYERYVVETLDSVLAQTHRDLVLVVVDDCSTDRSGEVVQAWMAAHRSAGIGFALLQNEANARLAATRNTGIDFAQTEYCFFLDADNTIYPRCIEKHVLALATRPDADAAYGLIEVFGGRAGIMGAGVFERSALSQRNYIDAMAMFRRRSLLTCGGFRHIDHGWEDYDLWLRLCEDNRPIIHIPEILSRYREHKASMLRTDTNLPDHIRNLHVEMTRLHPWLDLQ